MKQKLTLRSILIGSFLSVIVAMSAVYLALRMNAFYWASILTSLLAAALLKLIARLGNAPTNIHEVNATQSMASAGGIVAAGICFTFPALYFLDKSLFQQMLNNPLEFSIQIFIVAVTGGILGVVLSAYLRRPMIIEEALPFPTGIAAADTIKNVVQGTKNVRLLMGSFLFAGVFTTLRDGFGNIMKSVIPFFVGTSFNGFNFQFGLIPMTLGGGYLIGFRTAITWLAGCLLCNWLYQPVLVNLFNIDPEQLNLQYVLPAGVGIVVGSGVLLFIKTIFPSLKRTFHSMLDFKSRPEEDELSPRWIPVVLLLGFLVLTIVLDISLIASMLAIIGLWLMTVMAARMTGETNIDPMEIFAVIVVVAVNFVIKLTHVDSILLAGMIAVAVGVAADLLFDLKAGHLLGTSPMLLTKAQIIGVVIASTVVGISMISLVKVYQLGSPELFALQSQIVSFMIGSINWPLFFTGVISGMIITLFGFSGLAFGVGFFVPMLFSTGFALGGLAKRIVDQKHPDSDENMRLISAGLIGGEGISGSLLAIFKMIQL